MDGTFDCSRCDKLESLEGGPKYVNRDFNCYNCPKLKTLKGAPEVVHGFFACYHCGTEFIAANVIKYCDWKIY